MIRRRWYISTVHNHHEYWAQTYVFGRELDLCQWNSATTVVATMFWALDKTGSLAVHCLICAVVTGSEFNISVSNNTPSTRILDGISGSGNRLGISSLLCCCPGCTGLCSHKLQVSETNSEYGLMLRLELFGTHQISAVKVCCLIRW